MRKYAFLRSNASLIIICLLLGMTAGFKIANSQYRGERREALRRDVERATSGMPSSQAEVSAIIEKARANPNDAEAQVEAAIQFIEIQRFQEALPFLEQARKVDPNNRRVNPSLGFTYYMLGQFDQAIDFLKRSREQRTDNPGVTALLISAYIQTRSDLDEAERLIKELEAQKVDPAQLAQIRADLDAARNGADLNRSASPNEKKGQAQKPKTTLSHGSEEPKIAK